MSPPTVSWSEACREIGLQVRRLAQRQRSPILVALDGGSGAGKSTLAAQLAQTLDAVVVPSDDFFAAHIADWEWDRRTVSERAGDVLDWRRLRAEALEPLLAGKSALWHPFDFESGLRTDGTYAMSRQLVRREAAPVIILDGAYSSGPQVADLVNLSVLIDVPTMERHRRLAAREDAVFLQRWHELWDEVEHYYFSVVRPREFFDIVVIAD
jgi:uridine kinase